MGTFRPSMGTFNFQCGRLSLQGVPLGPQWGQLGFEWGPLGFQWERLGFQWNYFCDRSQVKTYWRYSGPATGSTYNVWITPKDVVLRTLREAEKAGFRG